MGVNKDKSTSNGKKKKVLPYSLYRVKFQVSERFIS